MSSWTAWRHDDVAKASPDAATLRDFAPAAVLLGFGLVALLGASLSGDGRSGQYIVIGAPWSGQGRMMEEIHRADGGLASVGGFANVVLAASSRDDFAGRARQAGAWLVLPSPRIAGCVGLTEPTLSPTSSKASAS